MSVRLDKNRKNRPAWARGLKTMLIQFALSILLAALKSSVKNPKKAAQLRDGMLALEELIHLVFGDEPEFIALHKTVASKDARA